MKETPRTLLLVDDEESLCRSLRLLFEREGYTVESAHTLAEARRILASSVVHVVLQDMWLPDGDGLELFRERSREQPGVPFVFMTGQGKVDSAIEAMRLGARDFLLKPFEFETVERAVRAALGVRPAAGGDIPGMKTIVGQSPAIQDVWAQIDMFAPTDITILLLGESGTGKELFARAIHAKSKRAPGPFIELDCASLPSSLIEAELFGHERGAFTDAAQARKGKFELASGGTLFLDEIGNLSLDVQAKLLRVIQERSLRRIGGQSLIHVDIRIVGATNLDLEEACSRGTFRSDLYYRLAELSQRLPPLRERRGDIELLAGYFIREYNQKFGKNVSGLSTPALEMLEQYSWPGNVRELENVVRAALVRSEEWIEPRHLTMLGGTSPPPAVAPARHGDAGAEVRFVIPWGSDEEGLDLKELHAQVRKELEVRILSHLVNERRLNKAQIARYLRLDYKVLLDKLKQYGLAEPR